MASFRPIQPAPSALSGSGESNGERRGPVPPTELGKRIRSVAQACHVCRQIKAKCDGGRPSCGYCRSKDKKCGYDGEPGQSRQSAIKARMEHLEKLVQSLQGQSAAEASQLLEQIRSTDDVMQVSIAGSPGKNREGGSAEATPSARSESQTEISNTESASSASRPDLHGHQYSGSTARSSEASPSPNARSLGDLAWPHVKLIMPDAKATLAAIDGFFACSGKLFHVFSRGQAYKFYSTVFDEAEGAHVSAHQKLTATCCVNAIAAVGVQYSNDDTFAVGFERSFHDASRQCFDYLLETDSLDIIKVCTLYAMYNIMGKATVSLAYVEIGLGLSRRQRLIEKEPPRDFSQEGWVDYRRSWRTLIFFSSWLASTIGYMSGDAFQTQNISLNDMDIEDSPEMGSVVQAEMTKICILKAEILRMHLASKDITVDAIKDLMIRLQSWYGRLPSQMHIANLGRLDLTDDVRRSIYHLHLLYLGANMLLYRRIAAQVVRSQNGDGDHGLAEKPFEQLRIEVTEQAVLSAKHSARIVSMLKSEDGVFKRCWLVIFQSYTSCLSILHNVAQKQLHMVQPSEWADDLHNAKQCLDVLAFCATVDPVARKFHSKLSPIHSELERLGSTVPPQNTAEAPADYLLNIPSTADPARIELSKSLLVLVCRPFGDVEDAAEATRLASESNASQGPLASSPLRHEYAKPINMARKISVNGRLEWTDSTSDSFRWDLDRLGLGHMGMAHLDPSCDNEPLPVPIMCNGGGLRGVRVGALKPESSGESDWDGYEGQPDDDDERSSKRRCNRFLMSSHPSGWRGGEKFIL